MLMKSGRYFLVDHKWLFLFGYLFYFITPLMVGETGLFKGFPGIELYMGFYNRIPTEKIQLYIIITLCWLPAFYLGHFFFSLFKPYKLSLQQFPSTPLTKSISYIGLLLVLVLFVFTYLSRASIFGGYGSYDIGARGKMSSLLVIFNFFLIYQLVSGAKASPWLTGGTLLTAFLLLSMGGRMYVFQTFVILLVYKTSFAYKRWKSYHIVLFAVFAFVTGAAFGIWRMGASVDLQKAMYSFFAEPVFTWFSTSAYLIYNDVPLVQTPLNFLTSFFNLIPNTFFSLRPYIVSTSSMAQGYESPLGADSLWSNLVINFGSIGSVAFLFVTGFMLNFLRHLSESSRFGAVYYIMVCGMLPFQFFRDGFYLLNKQLFFNFLILPGVVLLVLKMLLYSQAKMKGIFSNEHHVVKTS